MAQSDCYRLTDCDYALIRFLYAFICKTLTIAFIIFHSAFFFGFPTFDIDLDLQRAFHFAKIYSFFSDERTITFSFFRV